MLGERRINHWKKQGAILQSDDYQHNSLCSRKRQRIVMDNATNSEVSKTTESKMWSMNDICSIILLHFSIKEICKFRRINHFMHQLCWFKFEINTNR